MKTPSYYIVKNPDKNNLFRLGKNNFLALVSLP